MSNLGQHRATDGYLAARLAGAIPRNAIAAVELAAWISMILGPIAMIVGHLGAHDLGWNRNFISTFAARGPNGEWITAAMLLAAAAMLGIGITAASREESLGRLPGSFIAMSMGAAASGLLLLAAYEETASGLSALRKLGFAAIRQQSFHDAGLLIFFYGAILALFVAGAAILAGRGAQMRIAGAVVIASGPLSYMAMTTAWPAAFGIAGAGVGLKQRAAFLLLWIGALVLLAVISHRRHRVADSTSAAAKPT